MFKGFFNNLMNINKASKMKEGTVKFFNNAKGFGFITVDETNEEIFVHTSNLMDQIKEDDKVSFDVEKGEKGLSAINVKLA